MNERLKAIKHDWVEKQKTYQFRPLTLEMNDVNWLIEQAERVEELEGNIKRHKDVNVELCKRIAELEMKYENTGSMFGRQNHRLLTEENTRLREALNQISVPKDYDMMNEVDFIEYYERVARQALERESK